MGDIPFNDVNPKKIESPFIRSPDGEGITNPRHTPTSLPACAPHLAGERWRHVFSVILLATILSKLKSRVNEDNLALIILLPCHNSTSAWISLSVLNHILSNHSWKTAVNSISILCQLSFSCFAGFVKLTSCIHSCTNSGWLKLLLEHCPKEGELIFYIILTHFHQAIYLTPLPEV